MVKTLTNGTEEREPIHNKCFGCVHLRRAKDGSAYRCEANFSLDWVVRQEQAMSPRPTEICNKELPKNGTKSVRTYHPIQLEQDA